MNLVKIRISGDNMGAILNYIKTSPSFTPDNIDPSSCYVNDFMMLPAIHSIVDYVKKYEKGKEAKVFLFKGTVDSFHMKMVKDINALKETVERVKNIADIPGPLSCIIKIIQTPVLETIKEEEDGVKEEENIEDSPIWPLMLPDFL